ncbi:MAG TPA: glycosyltransferase family 39 protein, partial [Patescibacteria group bacterium]|nr:glycosyltransferase family 39 protein [Patescibacteria group bacterium]
MAGLVLGAATCALYLVGAGRSFGYDAAATFSNFVATPSIWDAFAWHTVLPTVPIRLVATNHHVLISLLSHLIYSATGSRSEFAYRVIPALAAGGTVGVCTAALGRRFGLAAGISAGLFIATDPLFVDNSRDLRGYSLAALGSVVATLLLAGKWTRPRLAAYALVMGLAMTAHVFAGVVLVAHVAWIATRRSRP